MTLYQIPQYNTNLNNMFLNNGMSFSNLNFQQFKPLSFENFMTSFSPTFGDNSTKKEKTPTEVMEEFEKLYKSKQEMALKQKEASDVEKEFAKSKNGDGTATIVPKLSKMSTWEKIKRGFTNMVSGFSDLCKSIVGYDDDGKWNPKKCLRNVAIAAVGAAVCVFAAPVAATVATSLGASAATAGMAGAVAKTALVTVPTIAALAGGAVKAGKGVYDTCKAETTEEFDQATQSIGQGVAVSFAARSGLKKMSASAGLSSSGVKGFFKNTFVNPFKATHLEANAAVKSISSYSNNATTGFIGKIKAFFGKIGLARNGIKNFHADVKVNNFNKQLNNTRQQLQNDANKFEQLANNTTDTRQKALYELQRDYALACEQKLQNVTKMSDLKDFAKFNKEFMKKQGKPYKWYQWGSKEFDINGQKYTKAELKELMVDSKKLNKMVKNNIKQKYNLMSDISGSKKYGNEVSDFGFSTKWYARPYNWAVSKWNQGLTKMEMFGLGMTALAPVYALDPLRSNPTFMATNLIAAANPTYNKSEGEIISAEQVQQQEQQITQAKAQIQQQILDLDHKMENLA